MCRAWASEPARPRNRREFASCIERENSDAAGALPASSPRFLPLAFVALLCLVHAVIGWRRLMVLGGLICWSWEG